MAATLQSPEPSEEFVRELTDHQTAMLAYIRSLAPGSPNARDLLQASTTLDGRRPVFGPASWKLANGSIRLADGRLEGRDFTAFVAMPPAPDAEHAVLLASMELATPTTGSFHSPGWAGLSFYQGDTEHLFFGDSFGPELTWSIDVKQGQSPALPTIPVTGARTVTLRYDFRTGETSLHEGAIPLGPAFVKGLLPPGLSFDRVRLGSSSEATIAVRSIDVRLMDR